MAFSLSRNAKLYVSTAQTIALMTDENTWENSFSDENEKFMYSKYSYIPFSTCR